MVMLVDGYLPIPSSHLRTCHVPAPGDRRQIKSHTLPGGSGVWGAVQA